MTTEEIILNAATRVFQHKGYAAARMDEIAKEAGMNRALLHYYFRSKEKMFEIIFAEKFKAFFSGIASIFLAEIPIFTKVEALVELELRILAQNPDLPLFIIGELNRDPQRLIQLMQKNKVDMGSIIQVLEKQLQKEIAAGTIRNISAISFVMNVMSLCIYPFIAKNIIINIAGVKKEEFISLALSRQEEITGFIIRGLKP